MPHRNQHIALKNKAKKGLLFFTLMLGIFAFSGGISIAQQSTAGVSSEWVLSAPRITKRTVCYSRIARRDHHKQDLFLSQRHQFAIATATFNRDMATRQAQQAISAPPKPRIFLQIHNHIPKATEPPHQA